jgi:hypothetical protein
LVEAPTAEELRCQLKHAAESVTTHLWELYARPSTERAFEAVSCLVSVRTLVVRFGGALVIEGEGCRTDGQV